MINNPNPKIRKIMIGKRNLREIEILPLSIADQFKLSDIITESINFAISAASEKKGDVEFIAYIVSTIQKNLDRILEMSTDPVVLEDMPLQECKGGWFRIKNIVLPEIPKPSLLDDITNDQALEIATIIYEINYGEIVKKVQSLLNGNEGLPSLLRGLLQSFSANIPSTESTTSTEVKAGEKVV